MTPANERFQSDDDPSPARFDQTERVGSLMNETAHNVPDLSAEDTVAPSETGRSPDMPAAYERFYRDEAIDASRKRIGAPVKPVGLTSWIVALFMIVLAITVGTFLFTARFARVESVPGSVEPVSGAARVVAPRSAVITEVHVADGQVVEAGAPLFTLGSDVLVKGGAPLGRILEQASQDQADALAAQGQAVRAAQRQQFSEFQARQRGLAQRVARLEQDAALARRRLALSEATLGSYDELKAKGYMSEVRYRNQQAAVFDDERAISVIVGEIEASKAAMAESDAAHRRQDAQTSQSLAGLESSRAALSERSASSAAQTSVVIFAPKSGRVSLQTRAGSAVNEGGALAVVLPPGTQLKAQLWAPSRAAGFVQIGDRVRLLYDAFPYQRFGAGEGRVVAIASAPTNPSDLPFQTEAPEALYRIDVELTRQHVTAYGRDWPLAAGSRLTGDVVLESRTLASTVLDPIRAIEKRRLQ